MNIIDDAVLAVLRAAMPTEEQVHDGEVHVERAAVGEPVVVRYRLPYLVYYSNVGAVSNRRLAGRNQRHSTFWSLIGVGATRHQAKAALERARVALVDKRLAVEGYRMWPTTLEESQRIRRDDDAIRPDGSPLFYGVDNYAAAHVIKQVA